MKITTPEEKQNQLILGADVIEYVEKFEKELISAPKSNTYYLEINRHLLIDERNLIKKLYENSGWKNVVCDVQHNDDGNYKQITFLKLEI